MLTATLPWTRPVPPTPCFSTDGSLHIASEVDPLFLLLPALSESTKFRPLDQILASEGGSGLLPLRMCAKLNLSLICEVNGA